MARKTIAQRGRELLSAKTVFPEFNLIDYDASMSKNLAFYNNEVDNKVKKAAAISYWKNRGKDVSSLTRLGDSWFTTVGALAHMIDERNIAIRDEDEARLEERYRKLCAMRQEKESVEPAPAPKVDKTVNDVSELKHHLAEFDAAMDVIYTGGIADAKAYLSINNIKPSIAKLIAEHYRKNVLAEIEEIPNCDQLQEAYSNYSKKELKSLHEKVVKLVADCEAFASVVKARKPRAKKKRPPSVIAKGVKFLHEYPELKMKSIHPEKLVESSEVWIFNVKIRRLFRYVAMDGEALSVKGTTLINYDPIKSGGKIVRKPEVQLSGYDKMTSRPLNKLYSDINAVKSKVTGRINEDCIILKVF